MGMGFASEYYPTMENNKLYSELYKKYTSVGKYTEENLFK
jgi:hypothetical protein